MSVQHFPAQSPQLQDTPQNRVQDRIQITAKAVQVYRLSQLSVEDHLAWDALSRAACADSIFAASWFVASVLSHFDTAQYYRLFVVKGPDGQWDGVFVAARASHLGKVPLSHMSSLLDANQFMGGPLVRPGAEARFWGTLLAALDKTPLGCNAVCIQDMPSDHRITTALLDMCGQTGRVIEKLSGKPRAIWRPSVTQDGAQKQEWDRYISPKKRRRMATLEKQLVAKHGPVHLDIVADEDGLERWMSEFLAIELASWKGLNNSALASSSATTMHFRQIARMGFAAGAFQAVALRLGEQPIAMTSYFLCADYGFGFKTAYDENFARFGPGTLLQKAVMELHQQQAGLYFDSCSSSDADFINRLWPDRRVMMGYLISIGDWPNKGRFIAATKSRKLWHKLKSLC